MKNRGMVVTMDDGEHSKAGDYLVQLRLGDQMRAELEAKRMGLKATDMPINLQGLFAWAAMVREGHYDGPARTFSDDCVWVEDDKSSDEDVDPTVPRQSSA